MTIKNHPFRKAESFNAASKAMGAARRAVPRKKPRLASRGGTAGLTSNREGTELLTTGEVASQLHIHANTVRRWGNSGVLKPYRLGTRADRRFSKSEVMKLLRRRGADRNATSE